MRDFITSYPTFSFIVFPLLAGGLVLFTMIKAGVFSKARNPGWGNQPKPTSIRGPWLWRDLRGWGHWKAPIKHGNIDIAYDIPPYIAHHALSTKKDSAIIRSGCWYYSRKVFIGFHLNLLIFALSSVSILIEYKSFSISGGACTIIEKSNGTQVFGGYYLGKSFSDMLYQRYCIVRNVLFVDERFNKISKKIHHLSGLYYIKYYAFTFSTIIFVWLFFSKSPSNIVLDRRHRYVYTMYKRKIYVARWNNLAFTTKLGYGLYSLGIELYTKDKKDEWQSRWFSIAGHRYYGEQDSGLVHMLQLGGINRWHSFRLWLLRYMERGPEYVHPPLPFKGILDHLTFRHGTLPEDIGEQVQALLGDEPAPSDPDFDSSVSENIKIHIERRIGYTVQDMLTPANYAKFQSHTKTSHDA